jgi:hypothetical protein
MLLHTVIVGDKVVQNRQLIHVVRQLRFVLAGELVGCVVVENEVVPERVDNKNDYTPDLRLGPSASATLWH